MKKKLIFSVLGLLIAAGVIVAVIVFRRAGDVHDPHEGHNHGPNVSHEEKSGEKHDEEHDQKDDHAGHDHSKPDGDDKHDDKPEQKEKHDDKDGHEGHDHAKGAHDDKSSEPQDHSEEEGVQHVDLTPEQRKRIGLQLAVAGPGSIAGAATFPGEIILNPDRVLHVVPPASGIVREVKKTLGDAVKAGEILAWVESGELAEAKLAFYSRQAEVGCCMINLPRSKAIFNNTAKLLALLKKEASQKELRKLDALEMGGYRGRLLIAYAEHQAARETYQREKSLRAKNISSGQELLEAETAHKKAREEFRAVMDTVRFETMIAYSEAAQQRQVAEFEAVAAEKRLRLKGADDKVVASLLKLLPRTVGLKPCVCDDPNCKDGQLPSVITTLGRDKRFAWYPLRALFGGFIIEKHLTPGEKLSGDESVFSIADISSVWVRFNIYQKDLALVNTGKHVRVLLESGDYIQGKISYVSPVVDEATRSVQARVVLENKDGSLRPGLFLRVQVKAQARQAAVVVPKSAIQILEEKNVVFIEEGDGFEAVPVKLGATDDQNVIVTSGLRPGQRYVVAGAFDLKAKIVSSGLGAHAGHGH
jgi:membrane fusion protein, heavy metal efflux system